MEKRVPKDPNDVDGTLSAVLDNVKFRNENGRLLADYRIDDDEVVLTYK